MDDALVAVPGECSSALLHRILLARENHVDRPGKSRADLGDPLSSGYG